MAEQTAETLEPPLEQAATAAHASGDQALYAMPATPGQVRFWSLDRLNPGNPALNMPLMWQFTGPLDHALLTAAFDRCTERHESLRTTFALVEGRLSEIIHPAMPVGIPEDDLTGLAGEAQRLEADRITRAHAALRMDLERGPLLALRLLRLGPASHLLLVTMHHIICDGMSNGILMRDMVAFYQAGLAHTQPRLPELPIQFADYAVWHEGWREGPEHERSLAFWRATLGANFTPMRLPRDPDAAALLPTHRQGATGDIQTLLVPPDLNSRAHAFSARAGVTLNVLFFAVFCTLLSRLTESDDLTIGSPCANRTEDTEDLIGLFMNIQVLRLRLPLRATFDDVLRQVQEWTLAAVENQALPFEDILHDPFFGDGEASMEIPIFFLYQKSFMLTARVDAGADAPGGGSLTVVPLRSESPGAVFELMFAIVDREEEGPRLQLEYNPQHYKAASIQNYLRLYVNLLEAVLATPALPIRELPLLSTAGRDAILHRWNQTFRDFGPFEPVHHTILRGAQRHPERLAIECDGARMSYGELSRETRALAGQLTAQGVMPGELVGLCVTRSPRMVVALLAILAVGAAYLPLDPRHPRERLASIMDDSGAQLCLTDTDLPLPASVRRLDLDRLPPGSAVEDPAFPVPPDALAYVIYTSGSTGTPKGVAIEHAALRNLLCAVELTPGFTAADSLLAITTLSFDIAALELLLPLLTGGRLIIATDAEVSSPALLLERLTTSGATVLQATPGAWRSLIDQGWAPQPGTAPLKVLTGGDALSRDLADKLLDRSSEVWNMYGPTETTIWSSATRQFRTAAAPRVGPPLSNTQFYVLDDQLEPLPPGVTGELYIGGAGLARGYWRRPELTEQRFPPDPFGPKGKGGRIYRTGDLARLHDDGSVHLLGRADFQVKVRGYRIELGEIEAALALHPLVSEAVVVHHTVADSSSAAGVTRMIGYVAVGEHAAPDRAPALLTELEARLSRTLPDYMLPNVLHAMEALPHNTNGKIDRKALPDIFTAAGDAGLPATDTEELNFQAPRDILERQLTELWQATLGIRRISTRASFFSLGVGSLAALRLITRMNRTYAMDLGLASLISASSIESVAELIRNRFSANSSSTVVPLKPEGSRPPLFIVHGVGGNIINFFGLATRIDPDQPVYAIQSQALLAGQPGLLRLEDMAAFYLRELRKVQPHGPYHLLGYSFGGTVVLEMAHQLRAAGETTALLGMLDARSLSYEREQAARLGVGGRLDRNLRRVRGNTNHLPAADRIAYIADKLKTRAIRFACAAASALHLRQVPAFMKSAYDINYVALKTYRVRPYPGPLTLFRAAEQDFADAPADLGWSPTFPAGVTIHPIPGDHERIFLEPSIDLLARGIREALAQG